MFVEDSTGGQDIMKPTTYTLENQTPLVARLNEQDPEAMQEFYRLFRPRIMNVARRMMSNEWDAEEVMQDVAWTVYRKSDTFRGDTDLWRWIYRITCNAALMRLRKQKRVPLPCADNDIESLLQSTETNPIPRSPERATIGRLALERMQVELREMDPVNRTLFQELELQGRTKEQVADHLGLSVPAVKARLHRVRKTLRHRMEDVLPVA